MKSTVTLVLLIASITVFFAAMFFVIANSVFSTIANSANPVSLIENNAFNMAAIPMLLIGSFVGIYFILTWAGLATLREFRREQKRRRKLAE